MLYEYELTEEAAEEIDTAIQYYENQFTSGASDFLNAYDHTISLILRMPESAKRRSEKDPDIRGKELSGEEGFARRFPYLLIYKVYEQEKKVVIFQLWPIRSNLEIREAPE